MRTLSARLRLVIDLEDVGWIIIWFSDGKCGSGQSERARERERERKRERERERERKRERESETHTHIHTQHTTHSEKNRKGGV